MPGHMGSERVTAEGLEIVDVRAEENLVFVKGSIPGSENGLVLIHKAKRGKVKKQAEPAKKK